MHVITNQWVLIVEHAIDALRRIERISPTL
jgi:hypothetical protein